MFPVFLLFSIIYALIIIIFTVGILFLKKHKSIDYKEISIIIAARNEEQNLASLIVCLANLEYPAEKFEIIIVDDRSTDRTNEILREKQKLLPNLKLITVKDNNTILTGKKSAIDLGIREAANEYLVFTDADCLPGKNWLLEINRNWSDKIDFWAGYSPLILKNPLNSMLKNLERASIFAVTAGSFGLGWAITCTARNMGYRKSVFLAAGGFTGISQIPSGDDDLLLQKMSHRIREYQFLFQPEATVWSKDRNSAGDQIELETRRASKWKYYPAAIKLLSLFVFVFYIFLSIAFFMVLAGTLSLESFLILLLCKVIPEFLLLLIFLIKVKMLRLMLVFPLAELFYIPYFIYFGLKGSLGKYRWK